MLWRSLRNRRSDFELAVRRWPQRLRTAAPRHEARAVLSTMRCPSKGRPCSCRLAEAVCSTSIERLDWCRITMLIIDHFIFGLFFKSRNLPINS